MRKTRRRRDSYPLIANRHAHGKVPRASKTRRKQVPDINDLNASFIMKHESAMHILIIACDSA